MEKTYWRVTVTGVERQVWEEFDDEREAARLYRIGCECFPDGVVRLLSVTPVQGDAPRVEAVKVRVP